MPPFMECNIHTIRWIVPAWFLSWGQQLGMKALPNCGNLKSWKWNAGGGKSKLPIIKPAELPFQAQSQTNIEQIVEAQSWNQIVNCFAMVVFLPLLEEQSNWENSFTWPSPLESHKFNAKFNLQKKRTILVPVSSFYMDITIIMARITLMMTTAMMVTMMMRNEDLQRFAEGGRHLGSALMSSAAGRP